MRTRSIAIAALSTLLGIAAVGATEAVSALVSAPKRAAETPELPPGYVRAEVERVIGTDSGPVVLLRRVGAKRALPIWIGEAEGRAIARGHHAIETGRPMTHELLGTALSELGARVHHVRVDALRADDVYVGAVALAGEAGPVILDARPSDAIALALQVQAPIYLAPSLEPHFLTLGAR